MLRFCILALVPYLVLSSVADASELLFERKKNRITLIANDGSKVAQYDAYNNVASGNAPFPQGIHKFSHTKKHEDDAPGSAYGSFGIIVFNVPGRTGMGVHSGRVDAKNNPGPKHPTNGCIRTTDEAMKKIINLHQSDKVIQIKVVD